MPSLSVSIKLYSGMKLRESILLILIILCQQPLFTQSFERLEWPVSQDQSDLSMPYTGGFHNPQFSNMDLDGDGIMDLLIFDRDGNVLIPVLIKGGTGGPEYKYAPEYRDHFPELINWVLIRDYNGDQVPDIFTSTPVAGLQGITVYRGEQTTEGISFQRVDFHDQPYPSMVYFSFQSSEFPIYVARIDIPGIIDVDEDGDLDVLTFQEGDGVYVIYYENQSVERGYGLDSLIFDRVDACWGKFAESPFNDAVVLSDNSNCAQPGFQGGGINSRHSGSTVLPVDIDLDGALDVLLGDNGSSDIVYLRNGQESEDALMVEKDITYPSGDVPVQLASFLGAFHVDTDGNGSSELLFSPNSLAAGANSRQIWRYQRGGEDGQSVFQLTQEDFLLEHTLDLSGASKPTWVDVDGDDRLDLVVGVYGSFEQEIAPSLYYFRQTGLQSNPTFELVDSDFLNLSQLYDDPSSTDSKYSFAPVFADMDGDGDQDLICGEYWGTLIYGENKAGVGETIEVEDLQTDWMNIDVGQATTPLVFDFNGDGLKDLIIGERNGNTQNGNACGNINYFQNQGSSNNAFFHSDPQQEPNSPCFGRIITQEPGSFTGFSVPTLIPVEGKEELLVGANSGKLMRYTMGTNPDDSFDLLDENWGGIAPGTRSAAAVADVDGDDIFELIVGNNRGGLQLFKTELRIDGGTVGTETIGEHLPIRSYPNPSYGRCTVSFEPLDAPGRLKILRRDGAIVQSIELRKGQRTVELDLNGQSPGVYFIHMKGSNGSSDTIKFLLTNR